MRSWIPLIVFLLMILASCHKKNIASCPVSYSIDSSRVFPLLGTWDFIGFVDTATGTTDPPLCGEVLSDIIFTDTSAAYLGSPYNIYPLHYYGSALINYYDGSYDLIDSTHIQFSTTLDTKIVGVQQVAQFEQRFHTLLQQVTTYRIKYNLLTLYPDTGSTVMLFHSDE